MLHDAQPQQQSGTLRKQQRRNSEVGNQLCSPYCVLMRYLCIVTNPVYTLPPMQKRKLRYRSDPRKIKKIAKLQKHPQKQEYKRIAAGD